MGLFDSILGVVKDAARELDPELREYKEQYARDGGCSWYCDGCGTYMNDQEGFTVEDDYWVCTECGWENDVTEDNIVDCDEEVTLYNVDD